MNITIDGTPVTEHTATGVTFYNSNGDASAQFTDDGITLGKFGESLIEIHDDYMLINDASGDTVFQVSGDGSGNGSVDITGDLDVTGSSLLNDVTIVGDLSTQNISTWFNNIDVHRNTLNDAGGRFNLYNDSTLATKIEPSSNGYGGLINFYDSGGNASIISGINGEITVSPQQGMTVNGDMTVSGAASFTSITSPIASTSALGVVKVGSGLTVSSDGTLSASGSGGTTNYNDLSNKPQINSVTLSGNKTAAQLGFATVATSGDYGDLTNTPTIPSYSVFTPATSSAAGSIGLVPSPSSGTGANSKLLFSDGT